jgi:hypothetical protein
MGGGGEGFILELQGHRSLGKKSKLYFDYMVVFPFGSTILLVVMRTRQLVRDPNTMKE